MSSNEIHHDELPEFIRELEEGEDIELVGIREVCELVGGKKKPCHPSTVYRMIAAGILDPPTHPSPGLARFNKPGVLRRLRERIESGK